jgi:hypothetical protein
MVEQSIASSNSTKGASLADSESEIERLFNDGEHDEARIQALPLLDDLTSKSRGHYWLARIADSEEDMGELLRQVYLAYEQDPLDLQIAAKCIDVMYSIGNTTKALQFYRNLPRAVAESSEIQAEMFWIYKNAGWRAEARRTLNSIGMDEPTRPSESRRSKVWSLLLRSTIDKWSRLESDASEQRVLFRATVKECAPIDRQKYSTALQLYRLTAEIDDMLINGTNVRRKWDRWMPYLRIAYACLYVTLAAVAARQSAPTIPYPARLVALGVLGGCVVALTAWLFVRWKNLRKGTAVAGVVGVVIAVLGGALLRSYGVADGWPRVFGMALVFGAAISAFTALLNFGSTAYWYFWWRNFNGRYAWAWITFTLSSLSLMVSNLELRGDRLERMSWVGRLEACASVTESSLADQITWKDASTHQWMNEWCVGVGESFRHMKRYLVSPTDRGWITLDRCVRQQLHAFATENWRSARYRKPEPRRRMSPRERVVIACKFTIGVLVPGVAYAAIAPVLGLEGNTIQRSILLSVGWALLSLLFIIDPAIKEKTAVARDMVGTWSPFLSSKHEAPADDKHVNKGTPI